MWPRGLFVRFVALLESYILLRVLAVMRFYGLLCWAADGICINSSFIIHVAELLVNCGSEAVGSWVPTAVGRERQGLSVLAG